ncbi:hypothetical protein ABZW30_09695 [Kitasatospora sp. NPDC004669]|uniref:hypothetical protein n=1 Tax=Kitasatospora sp. NPDC004669 TaxID=3154555 RepID=UPI0033BE0E67
MTVLHSRNADAADPADVAGAADVKDPQDAAAETDLREDLGRYAELGAFTLSADTHAWYAAVDTVATPEDARGASTALAELRGRDLQQTWEAVTALAAEVKLDEPDSVAKTALLVELLQRVHRTSAVLTSAAYDVDLTALAAATADSSWRRENGVKLSWLRGRALRKQAAALATDRRVRREDLHEALTSAEIERRAWAALAPAGTVPSVPADGSLVDRTAQAFEAINTGLRDLARLLPDHDLDGLAFADLVDLVERLAADEGTLYRLPTIRSLRATLEEAGLGDLLAELTAAKADRRAAEAAYAARQALAGGQRDGLADSGELVAEEPRVEEPDVDAEAAARQALAGGQRDGLAEEAPVSVTAPVEAEVVAAEVSAKVPAEADAEVVEAASESDVDSVEVEVEVEVEAAAAEEVTEEEAPAAVVSLPAPSPAADDLVAAATEALAEAEQAEEPAAEVEAAVEVPAVEVEEPVEALIAEPEVVEVEESVAEVEVAVEAPAVEVEDAAAEVEEPVEALIAEAEAEAVVVELEEAAAVEPVAEAETAEESAVEVVAEPEPEVVAEPEPELVAEPEPELVAEPEPEPEVVEVEEPIAEVEVAVEPEAVEEAPAVEPEPAAAEPAEAPVGRPEKPDFTPGRPVTAYSADELLAVVRWIDGDGTERTDEELLRAAMRELGFARLGPRIKEALGAAVAAVARG